MTLLALAREIVMRPDMLKWTTTPPTAPGYYFVVVGRRSRIYGADGNDVAQVFVESGTIYFFGGLSYDLEDIAEYMDYWLGPLPAPEAPGVADSQAA